VTVNRRELLAFVASTVAVVWPRVGWGEQTGKVFRLGFLRLGPASADARRADALRSRLRELGYTEGKNISIEFRWAENVDQLSEMAAELVRMNVDVIFAVSSTEVAAAQQVTKDIPIVFAVHADPIGVGHVASLPRPGGNVTGLTMLLTDLVAKEHRCKQSRTWMGRS
jgi:putative tryptophan/tyrosine transport system substrate-binding protein